MADENIKQAFIEAFRATPEGITEFLTTPIPTSPSVATPGDVDAAIIANGICAKFVMDLFHPFAGATPFELLLRIGQHNSVLESAMLAGLEYIEGGEDEQGDFKILYPKAGATYQPGSISLGARAIAGVLVQVAVEVGEFAPVALDMDADGIFTGAITIESAGEFTAAFTGLFDDDSTETLTVSFTVEGDDDIQKLYEEFKAAYSRLGQLLAWANRGGVDVFSEETIGVLKDQFEIVKTKLVALGGLIQEHAGEATGLSSDLAILGEQISTIDNMFTGGFIVSDLLSVLAPLPTIADRLMGYV